MMISISVAIASDCLAGDSAAAGESAGEQEHSVRAERRGTLLASESLNLILIYIFHNSTSFLTLFAKRQLN